MRESWIQFLGGEDPLEREMASHSSTFLGEIPMTEKPGRLYSPWGHKRVGHDLVTKPSQPHRLT